MSSVESTEMKMITQVLAKLKSTDNARSILPTLSTQDLIPSSSPTPIDPIFSATSSASPESNDTSTTIRQQAGEEEDRFDATAINAGDLAHVVWQDSASGDGNKMKRNSYTASSDDERLRISEAHAPSPPIPIDPSFSASSPPSPIASNTSRNETQVQEDTLTMAAMNTDDIINVVWAGSDIFYKRSSMDFQPPTENLSNNGGSVTQPAAAVSGNNIHVVWHEVTTGGHEILYARSTDGGANV